jgi:hypothetical protein
VRVHEGIEQTDQQAVRDVVRKCRVTAGILSDDGTIYWPIADTTPSTGQNAKLLPFAGEKVTASGKAYQRGGSKAIVIEKIEAQATQKQQSSH